MERKLIYQELDYRKKIRTYSKRLFTTLSIASCMGYIATLVFRISNLSLYFATIGAVVSVISLILNTWSLTDHFHKQKLNEENGIQEKTPEKLTKICLDITSSSLFAIGGIIPILPFNMLLPFDLPIISTPFFALGCIIMTINCIHSMINSVQIDKHCNNEGITV